VIWSNESDPWTVPSIFFLGNTAVVEVGTRVEVYKRSEGFPPPKLAFWDPGVGEDVDLEALEWKDQVRVIFCIRSKSGATEASNNWPLRPGCTPFASARSRSHPRQGRIKWVAKHSRVRRSQDVQGE